ncbi:MAG TPA: hypothetical protein VFW23_09825 [Tepidisphaeraceae bacterium]|nr:hypothetical protein [Tepidisphaeraceae bacterium]
MKANISQDELGLMAYLHEKARGFSQGFALDPTEVANALDIPFTQLQKDSSYLAGKGLVGLNEADASSSDGPASILFGLWLTSDGEDFMRELEAAPGVATRITVAVVKETWSGMREIAVGVLTEYLRSRYA